MHKQGRPLRQAQDRLRSPLFFALRGCIDSHYRQQCALSVDIRVKEISWLSFWIIKSKAKCRNWPRLVIARRNQLWLRQYASSLSAKRSAKDYGKMVLRRGRNTR